MIGAVETSHLKKAAQALGGHIEFLLAPTVLHFASAAPAEAVIPLTDRWTCLFSLMRKVQEGKPAVFSAETPGCVGALYYFGFGELPRVPAAIYLAIKEKLKKDAGLAAAFYDEVKPVPAAGANLVFERLDHAPDNAEVDVVNLWVDALALSRLHTLANYDRAPNDNVIMPFSSGCQSIWTLPYKEKTKEHPKAVVGSLDPTVRRFLPQEALSFSLPAGRFLEMCANVKGSFLSP